MKKFTNSLTQISKSLLSLLLILCMLASVFPAASAFAFEDENDAISNDPVPEADGGITAPEEIIFDKSKEEDITLKLTPGNNSLLYIKHGSYNLVEDKDYTMSNNTITIKEWFLAKLPVGVQIFVLEMSDGTNQAYSITIIDGPPLWDQAGNQSQEQAQEQTGEQARDQEWEQSDLPFSDVQGSSQFYNDMEYVFTNGLMSGMSNEYFSPNTTLTRAMIATILYNHAGQPDASAWKNQFIDVSEGKYYSDAVKWAMENGIMIGYGDGFFGTNDPVTREQLATILVRYADTLWLTLPELRGIPAFNDAANISDYAKEALMICYRAGLIDDKSWSNIDPKGSIIRAETASIIHKFLETAKNS